MTESQKRPFEHSANVPGTFYLFLFVCGRQDQVAAIPLGLPRRNRVRPNNSSTPKFTLEELAGEQASHPERPCASRS